MNQDKIDFVILWVDGGDKEWQKEKEKYAPASDGKTDASNIRYRDWGLLKYWFRSVEQNAPWVNKIYFVTNGQKPSWLNTDYEKLVHVKHSDFMPKRYLPTFNANPIELNIHRIKDLSEQFVYFNDDMFITDYVNPTFFFKDSLPMDVAILNPIIVDNSSVSTHMVVNDIEYINKSFSKDAVIRNNMRKWFSVKYGPNILRTIMLMPFKKIPGLYFDHMPTSFTINDYQEAWGKYNSVFESTSLNKFRSREDVNQWLIKADRICRGRFAPRSPRFCKNMIISDDTIDDICSIISEKRKKIVCLNDCEYENIETFNRLRTRLDSIFMEKYPNKSLYEK